MLIAKMLTDCRDFRRLWMYDTFEGMNEPTASDGAAVVEQYKVWTRDDWLMARAPLDEVRRNLARTGISDSHIEYVCGKVEDTLPARAPEVIALLRLDTDWYESTRHELQHLYHRLSPRGVLIVDDYGHWEGARKAVDEFFAARGSRPLFARMDYTGRMIVKPG